MQFHQYGLSLQRLFRPETEFDIPALRLRTSAAHTRSFGRLNIVSLDLAVVLLSDLAEDCPTSGYRANTASTELRELSYRLCIQPWLDSAVHGTYTAVFEDHLARLLDLRPTCVTERRDVPSIIRHQAFAPLLTYRNRDIVELLMLLPR
jgi:hypothetical protein